MCYATRRSQHTTRAVPVGDAIPPIQLCPAFPISGAVPVQYQNVSRHLAAAPLISAVS